jgi:hypothetical protein
MADKINHPVRPGGLSKRDHEYIFALAEQGWKAHRIARAIEKHPATVQWFMYRSGLRAPAYRGTDPYFRNGRMIVPFTPEHDAFIEALRVQGYGLSKIAEMATKRFGHERSPHTINCRLVMLAAREVA